LVTIKTTKQMADRLYYAITDSSTGDDPKEFTAGFANRKEPLAFTDWEERARWVRETKLTSAKIITRAEAIKICLYDQYLRDPTEHIKACRIYGKPTEYSILKRTAKKS
jgi:hypothetical protein